MMEATLYLEAISFNGRSLPRFLRSLTDSQLAELRHEAEQQPPIPFSNVHPLKLELDREQARRTNVQST